MLVLHGPNLNLLGLRDPLHYGDVTLAEIDARLTELAGRRRALIQARQSNSEGDLVTWLQGAAFGPTEQRAACVVLNPGAYAHTSLALSDAVLEVVRAGVPVVEVHLSNVLGREAMRKQLLTAENASGLVAGLGPLSYDIGLDAALTLAERQDRQ